MCPHCVAITPQRFIWSPENAVRIIVDLFLVLFAIAIVPITIFDLWRRCERCGGSFVGDGWRPPRRHRCAVCGYNLRGNTSGRCPECGWQIPRGVVPALDEQQGRHADP